MNVSLDASAIVPLFVNDHFTDRIRTLLIAQQPELIVSDFAAAEFASVIARRAEARPADMVAAASIMRRLDLNLRTPDALNIAIAQRLAVGLVTFDDKMAANASLLGVPVVSA